jgi:hypothetical protein
MTVGRTFTLPRPLRSANRTLPSSSRQAWMAEIASWFSRRKISSSDPDPYEIGRIHPWEPITISRSLLNTAESMGPGGKVTARTLFISFSTSKSDSNGCASVCYQASWRSLQKPDVGPRSWVAPARRSGGPSSKRRHVDMLPSAPTVPAQTAPGVLTA